MPAILVINPGSTSTKLAFFQGLEEVVSAELEWNLPSGLRGAAAEAEITPYGEASEGLHRAHERVPEEVAGPGRVIARRTGHRIRRASCRARPGRRPLYARGLAQA